MALAPTRRDVVMQLDMLRGGLRLANDDDPPHEAGETGQLKDRLESDQCDGRLRTSLTLLASALAVYGF